MTKKVLILQNEIMQYRKPVYNGLAEHYEVVVLHSGRPSVKEGDRYREVISPGHRLWRFQIQPASPLRTMISDFDAVIAMFDLGWPAYLAPVYRRKRPKYILWGHWYSPSQLVNVVRDHLMKRADRLLMYGGEEIERMVRRGIDADRIVVAPNTVHVPDAKDYSGAPKNSLLFVGRLRSESRRNSKRVDILIEAFAHLQGRIRDDIVLDIVGGGEEGTALRELATQCGISHKVTFHGHIDNPPSLTGLYSKAIAYVAPGHVGLSVLQSFAYGVPVITGRAVQKGQETQHLHNVLTGEAIIIGPEYYNLRHGHNALLLDTRWDLEEKIEQLCNSPDYAAELGRRAHQYYVNERKLDHMIEGFRTAIED